MSLTANEGHEVTMTKSIPDQDCLERNDLVQTFCNFLVMAGYVFPSDGSFPWGKDLEEEMNSYNCNDFLRKKGDKVF
jgi:hypothetical protein